jgi:hypothetical protein
MGIVCTLQVGGRFLRSHARATEVEMKERDAVRSIGMWRVVLLGATLAMGACGTDSATSDSDGAVPVDPDATDDDATLPGEDDAQASDTTPGETDGTTPEDVVPDGLPDPDPDTTEPGDDVTPDDDVVPDDDTTLLPPDPIPECEPDAERVQRCDDGSSGAVCRCVDGQWTCSGDGCRDARCDDESILSCLALEPTCGTGEIAAIRDGCWTCLNAVTCLAPGTLPIDGICTSDAQCRPSQFCGRASTPGPPIRRCTNHSCRTESAPTCDLPRISCAAGEVSVVRGGCWVCVDAITCEGDDIPEPSCTTDIECATDAWCNDCASSSCDTCDDCIGACEPLGCESESVVTCRCVRPTCGEGGSAIVRDGCWVCVDRDTCRARVDEDTCGL